MTAGLSGRSFGLPSSRSSGIPKRSPCAVRHGGPRVERKNDPVSSGVVHRQLADNELRLAPHDEVFFPQLDKRERRVSAVVVEL
jgi:hypothetical protein